MVGTVIGILGVAVRRYGDAIGPAGGGNDD
jgi:hypothetical protein